MTATDDAPPVARTAEPSAELNAQLTAEPTAELNAQLNAEPSAEPSTEPEARPEVAALDAALTELPTLDALPVEHHVDVYERAHRQLQAAMADTDNA